MTRFVSASAFVITTCWSFSSEFLAWIMKPLKVELSFVPSSRLISWPGSTLFLARLKRAGLSPVWGAWSWPGVMSAHRWCYYRSSSLERNLPWHAESGAPIENEDTSLSLDVNRMKENNTGTNVFILNHLSTQYFVWLKNNVDVIFSWSESMKNINYVFSQLNSWHQFSLLISQTSVSEWPTRMERREREREREPGAGSGLERAGESCGESDTDRHFNVGL